MTPASVCQCVHCGLPVPAARRTSDGAASRFCCFGCRLVYDLASVGPADHESTPGGRVSPLFLRLGAGIFLLINIGCFSFFFYSRDAYALPAAEGESGSYRLLSGLFAYLMMFLCTLVLAILGAPLAADTFPKVFPRFDTNGRLVWQPRIDTHLLILIGVAAAFVLSVVHTVRGNVSQLYFETAAATLVLLALGSYLESRARLRATRAAMACFEKAPDRAWVARGNDIVEVSADAVAIGDRVRVRPGEAIPVDGLIATGRSHINESSLTGEFQPRPAGIGDRVLAGSVNVDGMLWIDATAVGEKRTVSQMRDLLERARLQQPRIQRLADRIAAAFVPGVLVLAVAVFAWHALAGTATQGMLNALAVLLISCPCALGLSAPLATWTAMGRAARRGVLIGSGATLERLAAVNRVMFDKTGTLSTACMHMTGAQVAPGWGIDQALTIAASIETASTHPVAQAIVADARRRGLPLAKPDDIRIVPGAGVEATLAGRAYRIGGRAILTPIELASLEERTGSDSSTANDGCIDVYLCESSGMICRFSLAEELRADARATLVRLREMGIQLEVITGDRAGPAQRLARELGVTVRAELLPGGKLDEVTTRRATASRRAQVIAVVGDGINDAPALAAADVGFAMGGGADLARQAGNVHLISDRLMRVPESIALARHSLRRIKLNLAWAFGYNALGLFLAATGTLKPIFAASTMIVSSLMIIAISSSAGAVDFEGQAGDDPKPVTSDTDELRAAVTPTDGIRNTLATNGGMS